MSMEKLFSFLLSFVLIAKSSRPNTIEWVCSDRDVLWVNRKPTRLNGVYILKSVNNSVPFPCQDSPGSSAELQTCSLTSLVCFFVVKLVFLNSSTHFIRITAVV